MTEKIINILTSEHLIIPKLLLKNYKTLKISDFDLIVLICLMNNSEFNPEKLAEDLNVKSHIILKSIDNLSKQDILKIKQIKESGKCKEEVCLDQLYNKLALIIIEDKQKKPTNIYDIFEQEFSRPLSPMEYEIIGAWLDDSFTEEIILCALKEATFNGVTNLRYIDKILYEWKKKGINTKQDVISAKKTKPIKKQTKEVFDYDWLDE